MIKQEVEKWSPVKNHIVAYLEKRIINFVQCKHPFVSKKRLQLSSIGHIFAVLSVSILGTLVVMADSEIILDMLFKIICYSSYSCTNPFSWALKSFPCPHGGNLTSE